MSIIWIDFEAPYWAKLDKANGFTWSHLLREKLYCLQGQIPPSSIETWGGRKVRVVNHITQNKENMAVEQDQSAAWIVLFWGTLK